MEKEINQSENENNEANSRKTDLQVKNSQSAVKMEIAKNYLFRKKIISTVLPVVIAVFVLVGVAVCYVSFDTYRNEKFLQLEHTMEMYTADIKNLFYGHYRTGYHYNNIVQNFNEVHNNDRRKYYSNLTQAFLEKNPAIYSVWFEFDANKFDVLDAKNLNGNTTGHFNKLYYRGSNGKITRKINFDDEIADGPQKNYFYLPRELKRPVVIAPYSYTYDQENIQFVISICFPVFDDSNDVIGVTGIDILLDTLICKIRGRNPYGINHIVLMTSSLDMLLHYDDLMIGKHLKESIIFNTLSWDAIYSQLQEQKKFDVTFFCKTDQIKKIIYFEPVELSPTDAKLIFGFVFYYEEVTSDAWSFVFDIMLYFIVALFLVVVAIFLFSTFLYNSAINRVKSLQ